MSDLWNECLETLEKELPQQQFNTWVRPLQGEVRDNTLALYAPNKFVLDWVQEKFLPRIESLVTDLSDNVQVPIALKIGSLKGAEAKPSAPPTKSRVQSEPQKSSGTSKDIEFGANKDIGDKSRDRRVEVEGGTKYQSFLNPNFTFDTFVEGKSNQLARAAAVQVAENPGGAYNPLFLYGGVGLGKTHLMHSIGNEIVKKKPQCKSGLFAFRTLCGRYG